jgi:hypothetical protein
MLKIDVTNCKDCIFFIGSEYSNAGHCSMWNKSTTKQGYCHRAETEVLEENE